MTISQVGDSLAARINYSAPGGGPFLALAAGLTLKGVGIALLFTPAAAAGAALIVAAPAVAAATAFVPSP